MQFLIIIVISIFYHLILIPSMLSFIFFKEFFSNVEFLMFFLSYTSLNTPSTFHQTIAYFVFLKLSTQRDMCRIIIRKTRLVIMHHIFFLIQLSSVQRSYLVCGNFLIWKVLSYVLTPITPILTSIIHISANVYTTTERLIMVTLGLTINTGN